MHDRVRILIGLAIFVALFTLPLWRAWTTAGDSFRIVNLSLPAGSKECIAPAAVMRSQHMQLLVSWREDVVRHGDRRYIGLGGKVYEKSLTHTCLGCHDKEQFCDRCHEYAGVSGPYCWNCHNQPQQTVARSLP